MKRRFFKRLVLLLMPHAAILGLPILLAAYVGEAMPLRMVVNLQNQNDHIVYGPLDAEIDFAYKLFMVETRQPEIVMVGSSRVQQYRAQFFNKNPGAFYNFFLSAGRLTELQATAHAVLDSAHLPKVMFLGLDLVWFNEDYANWTGQRNLGTQEIDFDRVVKTTRTVVATFATSSSEEKTHLMEHEDPEGNPTALGLSAILKGSGFRQDGSLRNLEIIHTDADALAERVVKDLDHIQHGEQMYQEGAQVSQAALDTIADILAQAQTKNIEVIGVSMPYTSVISHDLAADGNHEYLPKAATELDRLFASYGYSYFNFTSPQSVGGSDQEMYDGFHSGELLSLRIYLTMVRALPDVLDPYSDLDHLENTAHSAKNPFQIFDS